MEFLLDPNVAYVLLVVGMFLGLMALVTPGTGLLEIGALLALVVAGYGAYNNEINAWAFIPLALATVPFLYALRYRRFRAPLLAATILLVVGGSVFLFRGTQGQWLGVNPLLATVVSLLSGGLLWIAVERSLAALQQPITHNLQALIGQAGEARTRINDSGSVQVGGELWSARSEKPIEQGKAVRVVHKDGFVLVVEEFSK